MGLIIALLLMAVPFWFYGAANAADKNAFKWAAIGTATFLGTFIICNLLTYQIVSTFTDIGGPDGKTKPGTTIGILIELAPLIVALTVTAMVRNKFLKN